MIHLNQTSSNISLVFLILWKND